MNRTQIREEIFKMIYCSFFYDKDGATEQLEDIVNKYQEKFSKKYQEHNEELPEEEKVSPEKIAELWNDKEGKDLDIVCCKFWSVYDKYAELDKLIDENTDKWTVDRMNKVDASILRLGVYEIKFDEDVPNSVAINEAVNLAKKYGGDNSFKFVNAVLAKINS